jgi:NAD(P)-dependent dehydrogenase (short-subunit alcohol dehydrogenase family)
MTVSCGLADVTTGFRLDGVRAAVTGAGRGLGRGIALGLAAAGAEVAVISRTENELVSLAHELAERGLTGYEVHPCDVLDQRAFDEVLERIETVDAFVASAGTNDPRPFLDVDGAVFDRIFELNVRATFFTVQAVARRMVARRHGGSIVLLSSQMGHVGAANRTVYCATKHAIEGLTKALAIELAPAAIRVNSVAPTYIRTPMTEPFFADAAFRRAAESAIPLGRIGEVADVTGAVTFLCSPAASLITGTSLVIDGGYTAQ